MFHTGLRGATLPHVTGLFVYPIKSLDGISVTRVTPLKSGTLQHNNEFVLRDDKGEEITTRREPKLHQVRSTFDPDVKNAMMRLQGEDKSVAFHLEKDRDGLQKWFSDFLGYRVTLAQSEEQGFPDDPRLAGPVIIAANTLKELHTWFPTLEVDNLRRRVRPNIEMGGSLSFWEERLYSHPGFVIHFTIGKTLLVGVKPADLDEAFERDPSTGTVTPGFAEGFTHKRKEKLPAFVPSERFEHYYKLAVRTRLTAHEAGKPIGLGNRVGILERKADLPNKE